MLLLLISEAYAGGDGLPPDKNAIVFMPSTLLCLSAC